MNEALGGPSRCRVQRGCLSARKHFPSLLRRSTVAPCQRLKRPLACGGGAGWGVLTTSDLPCSGLVPWKGPAPGCGSTGTGGVVSLRARPLYFHFGQDRALVHLRPLFIQRRSLADYRSGPRRASRTERLLFHFPFPLPSVPSSCYQSDPSEDQWLVRKSLSTTDATSA